MKKVRLKIENRYVNASSVVKTRIHQWYFYNMLGQQQKVYIHNILSECLQNVENICRAIRTRDCFISPVDGVMNLMKMKFIPLSLQVKWGKTQTFV